MCTSHSAQANGATLLVLFLMTGSIVLPIKAIALNLLTIASVFGRVGGSGYVSAYVASKHGVIGLTRSAATEFMFAVPGTEEHYAALTPLGRVGEPEDLASAVRFFAGPESAWITGQNIACDGGQELGRG